MKEIKLTQGRVALVDDEDYDFLNQWKWRIYYDKHKYYYAKRTEIRNGRCITIRMHRLIMKTPPGMETDHIDHDGLNNQRYNLRNVTHAQNQMNRNAKANGLSKYLGVCLMRNKYRARIRVNNRTIHLGCFEKEDEAAIRYDRAAILYHGEFANLNFK
jgi:hypothetical protein